MLSSRDLQCYVRSRIELALRGRSWAWLAREADIPQSTLGSQKVSGKFTLYVLLLIADVLDRPVTYFLPQSGENLPDPAHDLIDVLESLL